MPEPSQLRASDEQRERGRGLSRREGQQPGLSALPADDREADRARTAADAAEGGRREYERVAPRGKRAASQATAEQGVGYARAAAAREAPAGDRAGAALGPDEGGTGRHASLVAQATAYLLLDGDQ